MLELLDDDDVYAQQAALQVLGNLASDAVDPHSRRTKEAVLGLGLFDRVLAHLHNEKGATRVLALGAVQNLCVLPAFAVLLDAAGVAPKLRELAATRSRDAPANQAHYARGCLANMEAAIAAKAGKADTVAAPVADADADADAAPSAAAPSAAGSSLQHGGLPDLSVGGARRTPAEPLYARARDTGASPPSALPPPPARRCSPPARQAREIRARPPRGSLRSGARLRRRARAAAAAPRGAAARPGGRSGRGASPVVQEVLDRAKANREAATPPSPQAPEGAPASPAASPPASASPAAWKPLKACGEAAIADVAGGGAPGGGGRRRAAASPAGAKAALVAFAARPSPRSARRRKDESVVAARAPRALVRALSARAMAAASGRRSTTTARAR